MARLNKSLLIRWIVGIGLIVYLFTLINFHEFSEILSKASLPFFFLAVLLVLVDRVWMGSKWNILLKVQGLNVSMFECVRVYFISSFLGLVLPTSVGGDLVRLFSLSVEKGEREKVAASLVVEKLLSMMALLLLVIFCVLLLVMTSAMTGWRYFLMALGVFLGMGLIFVISLLFLPVERLRKAEGKWLKKIARVFLAYHEFRRYHRAMFVFFIVSVFEQCMPFLFNYSLAKAFHLPGSALTYFMIVPMIYMIARLPISVDGMGIAEALFVFLFPLMGLDKTHSLLLALAGRLATTLGHLIGGIFYFWKKKS
ncbi:MAG: flippase-like domain-containing protein [Chlamydiae bacterium]|nr:flippase-like domain-containing protein [Chlamydiota bacterium]MBI3266390.1 flippase-like domain-containing protein [Chlamydiota bacterium]